jgi:hypothetical protein
MNRQRLQNNAHPHLARMSVLAVRQSGGDALEGTSYLRIFVCLPRLWL